MFVDSEVTTNWINKHY